MKVFEHRNTSDPKTVCPVCKTNEDGETVLVPIKGTEDGNLSQAIQIHLKCINLMYLPPNTNKRERGVLVQFIEEEND